MQRTLYQETLPGIFDYHAIMQREVAMRACALLLGMGSFAVTPANKANQLHVWLSEGSYDTLVDLSPVFQTHFQRTIPYVND